MYWINNTQHIKLLLFANVFLSIEQWKFCFKSSMCYQKRWTDSCMLHLHFLEVKRGEEPYICHWGRRQEDCNWMVLKWPVWNCHTCRVYQKPKSYCNPTEVADRLDGLVTNLELTHSLVLLFGPVYECVSKYMYVHMRMFVNSLQRWKDF